MGQRKDKNGHPSRRRYTNYLSRRGRERYERGHVFEHVVEEYFSNLGYEVKRNQFLTGSSGARHEVDVALYKDGRLVGVVEAKNYSKPIPKEWVAKIHAVAKDLCVKEMYVVSASGFTEDAVKIAEITGVKLLNLDDMIRNINVARARHSYPVYHVKPPYSTREVREIAEKYAARRLFKPIEKPGDVKLVYLPFYMVQVTRKLVVEEGVVFKKEVERLQKIIFLLPAFEEGVFVVDEEGGYVQELPTLGDDEVELLNILIESAEPLGYKELEDETGWSWQKVSRTLLKLVELGLVEEDEEESESGRVKKVFYATAPSLDDLVEVGEAILCGEEDLIEGQPGEELNYPIKVDADVVLRKLKKLYGEELHRVEKVAVVYIPAYRVNMLSLSDDTFRYIYLLAGCEEEIPIDISGLE